jgi:hypothetical protein
MCLCYRLHVVVWIRTYDLRVMGCNPAPYNLDRPVNLLG